MLTRLLLKGFAFYIQPSSNRSSYHDCAFFAQHYVDLSYLVSVAECILVYLMYYNSTLHCIDLI